MCLKQESDHEFIWGQSASLIDILSILVSQYARIEYIHKAKLFLYSFTTRKEVSMLMTTVCRTHGSTWVFTQPTRKWDMVPSFLASSSLLSGPEWRRKRRWMYSISNIYSTRHCQTLFLIMMPTMHKSLNYQQTRTTSEYFKPCYCFSSLSSMH